MTKRISGDLVRLSGVEAANNIEFEDIRHFTNADLKNIKKVITKMNSVANKRAKRLEAFTGEKEERFSVKGIDNINDAKRAFMNVKHWLNREDKSVTGLKEIRKKSTEAFKKELSDTKGLTWQDVSNDQDDEKWLKDPENYKRFWKAWREMSKMENYNKKYKYYYLETLKAEAITHPNLSSAELANLMESQLVPIYEAAVKLEEQAETYTDITDRKEQPATKEPTIYEYGDYYTTEDASPFMSFSYRINPAEEEELDLDTSDLPF